MWSHAEGALLHRITPRGVTAGRGPVKEPLDKHGASLVAQWVKNPPVMQEPQETHVQSLGHKDPLEEGRAIHSSILAWRIPMGAGTWWANGP